MAKDRIYTKPLSSIPSFTFGSQVTEVFDDMISRSVPLYQEVCELSVALALSFAQSETNIYDLGSSTGTVLLQLAKKLEMDSVHLVGVDSSEPMIHESLRRSAEVRTKTALEFRRESILDTSLTNASVILCNYTLQFLPLDERLRLLERCVHATTAGGILVLTEKIRHPHPQLQEVLTELHHGFKRNQGYSELEISQKRTAIENVLIPLTIEENTELLYRAGYSIVYPVLTWYNFVTLLALKLEGS